MHFRGWADERAVYSKFGLAAPEDVGPKDVETMTRLARSVLRVFMDQNLDGEGGWTEDTRRELGRIFHVYHDVDRSRARARVGHLWNTVMFHHPELFSDEIWTLVAPNGIREYCVDMAAWYDQGFPKIVVEAQYAAALMATGLTPEIEASIIPPWSAFIIELKDSPLPYLTKIKSEVAVNHIFVRAYEKDGTQRWDIKLYAGSWEMLGLQHVSTAEMVASDDDKIEMFLDSQRRTLYDEHEIRDLERTGFSLEELEPFFEQNARLTAVAQRLVAGVCLTMSDPNNVRQVRPKPMKASFKSKHQRGLPLVRTFVLGRPVTVDCRSSIHDYVLGRKASVHNVQSLVRGHWKHQAHGLGRLQRKLIHVEPYWRGPEDAPIPIRPHTLERT